MHPCLSVVVVITCRLIIGREVLLFLITVLNSANYEEGGSAVYIDSRIDPLQSNFSNNNTNIHRLYNPLTQTLTFRGESIALGKLLIALEEIRYKCRHLALS